MNFQTLPTVRYAPPRDPNKYVASFDGVLCSVENGQYEKLLARVCEEASDAVRLEISGPLREAPDLSFTVALDYLFSHLRQLDHVTVTSDDNPRGMSLARRDFFQNPEAWLHSRGGTHGTLYRRYVPQLGGALTFRVVEVARDLDVFHDWHNQPRVYDLWELNKPKAELQLYLERGLADPHQIPLILEFDGEAVGYFEVYWAVDDRIARYYECERYDRGFHFLIGERAFLGRSKTDAAIRAVMHMIFLDESRTNRIVAEPRADNKLVMKCAERVAGWRFIKEFDFPHKRAALLMAKRADFFQGDAP